MIETLKKFTRAAGDALLRIAAAGLVLMTVIVGWQVFGRYVLNASPSWTEQAALFLMIWYVSFAAAAGVREGFHIRIAAGVDAAPPRFRRAMKIAAHLVVAACGAAMAVWGTELVLKTWSHVIPSLGLPRGLAYLGLPIAGLLIVLFAIERALEDAAGPQEEEQEGDGRWS